MTSPPIPRGPFALCLFCLGFAIGCGTGEPYDIVPISGVVTLDDKPVANVDVQFQPIAQAGALEAGPSSAGKADAQGRFELRTLNGQLGAVVGKHRVIISSPRPQQDSANDSGIGQRAFIDPIPTRYNTETTLTFDVPADGTTAADFKLTTQP